MGYIVQHNSLLRGMSLDEELQSAATNEHILEKTHINLLIFWECPIEITHELHMLTSSLKDGSVRKAKGQRSRVTSVSSCTYLFVLVYEYPVPGG